MLSRVLTTRSLYRYEERYAQDKQEQAEVMRRHEVQLEEMRGRIEKEMNEKLELKTAELERSQKAWFGGKKTKAAQEELARLQKEKEQQLAQAEQEKNAYLQQQRQQQEAKEKEHVEGIRVMEAKVQAIEAKEEAIEWRVLAATIPGWDAGAVTLCTIGVSSSRCRCSGCVCYRRELQ